MNRDKIPDLTGFDNQGLIRIINDAAGILELRWAKPTESEIVEERDPVIELDPSFPPPWVVEARKWEGMNEVDDQGTLTEFLGVNPNDKAGGVSWCAAFINSVMTACQIPTTGSLRAADFMQWGVECECVDGAIAVYNGHIGIVIGNGLLGGNQGDMVRTNKNRAWFNDNMGLIGYRWPEGYGVATAKAGDALWLV